MGGEARFDCRKRNMRKKWRVIQEEEKVKRRREEGRLFRPKLDNDLSHWKVVSVASSTERNRLSKVKSSSGKEKVFLAAET